MKKELSSILIVFIAFFVLSILASANLTYAQTLCYDGGLPTCVETPGAPNECPAGAKEGQPTARFCYINDLPTTTPGYPVDTSVSGDNKWEDNFNHGLSNTSFTDTDYVVFHASKWWPDTHDDAHRLVSWRHANHWMVDLTSTLDGVRYDSYALLRPNRTFTMKDYANTPNDLTDDMIIIEADAASGHQDYSTQPDTTLGVWQELVVSLGSTPLDDLPASNYAYDIFPGSYTFGCRLEATRVVICALKNGNGSLEGGVGSQQRIWEMSFFQKVGPLRDVDPNNPGFEGGGPYQDLSDYWRTCAVNQDPDTLCRDRFRLEITRNGVKLYVNGKLYFRQEGTTQNPLVLPPQPEGEGYIDPEQLHLLDWNDDPNVTEYHMFPKEFWYKDGDPAQGRTELYAYYADLTDRLPSTVVRYHWDNLTVNTDRPPSCAETWPIESNPDPTCQSVPGTGSTPLPTNTPTPTPEIAGDVNGDGTVNIQDFVLLSNAFGTNDPQSDINGDGTVNIQDFVILSNNFGT